MQPGISTARGAWTTACWKPSWNNREGNKVNSGIPISWTIAAVTTVTCLAGSSSAAADETAADNAWRPMVESRLKDIYEKGRFGAQPFRGDWLPDSSRYTVRERDPETNREIIARYDVRTGERSVSQQTERSSSDQRRTSPDGSREVQWKDRQLVIREIESGTRTQVTQHSDRQDIFYRDPIWSPDGRHLAFVESNETRVRQRSMLVPSDPSYPGVRQQRFARVGEKIAVLRIGVFDIENQTTTWLSIDVPHDGIYFGQVAWTNNAGELLVEKLSRFRDRREFLLADVSANSVRRIYEEVNDAWAIGSQGTSSGLIWVEDGRKFIVISEKDGWRHAFLYSRDGEQLAVLTSGEYDIIDRGPVDEAGGWFYFYASPENGTRKYLHRVPLDGSGKREQITPKNQPGTHDYDFSPDARWAFHTWSTLDSPPVTELVELPNHRSVRVLDGRNELRERMTALAAHPAEFVQLTTSDDITMDAWVMKPKDFDASKKYPIFIYVYGEPYAQTVLDKWGAAQSHFHRVVADLGYIVVSIDNRGTPAPKGAAWRRSIFGSLGPLSTHDQAAALEQFGRQFPWADLSRVAIWGWSGGGSNTLNAMFRKPELYHVGIAVVPKPQPHLYNAWFQEIYMRTRSVNPEGYQKSAPINFADGLQGKLLMITGSGETNTHIQIIEGLVDRLIELGKSFDYMVYPNRDHGLSEGKGTLVHVRMLIIRYLVEHLPRGPR